MNSCMGRIRFLLPMLQLPVSATDAIATLIYDRLWRRRMTSIEYCVTIFLLTQEKDDKSLFIVFSLS